MTRPALNKYPEHVRSVFERVEGTYVNHCIATCGVCGVPRSWPRFPADVTAKYLLQRGYLNPLDPRRCTCPQCAAVPASAPHDGPVSRVALAAAMPLPAPRAAPKPANPPKPKAQPKEAKPMTVTASVPRATPPRLPTVEDNQRILDKLFEVYDRKLKCYSGKGSDEALAAELGVPRAWVSTLRGLSFGEDTNAFKEGPAQLKAMKAALKAVESDALDLAARAESAIRTVEAYEKRFAQAGAA